MTDRLVEMVVFVSRDGVNDWKPTPIQDLPEWVLDPVIMGRLADGEECNDPARGAAWYRAVKAPEPQPSRIVTALQSLAH